MAHPPRIRPASARHSPHIRPASPHYQVSRKDADQVTGTLKWKQLWLTTLLVPVAIGIVIAHIVISNSTTGSRVDGHIADRGSVAAVEPAGVFSAQAPPEPGRGIRDSRPVKGRFDA
ncbi:hypothetical protein [Cryobacterium sp. HLT2-28]|uniref:hypothetical protein n=1 Tax=Cryobacterium sp. HLT2-28 TaxID=1259146 RepID=UPI001069E978|nr:hypothetical protein [Cryobacterium sp. HLT2-28]TFB93612.1 hypothetical protein E3O48_10255 [Cryobacterium sp. HLT2-28]